jgi:hypothetical protein
LTGRFDGLALKKRERWPHQLSWLNLPNICDETPTMAEILKQGEYRFISSLV